ncbi:hypothetical protein KOI35_20810 [Actinoplanes bogorensis]|uniref:SDR family NAD(P)-dependent oxidoreductase n=1 Tax=Paractinoplanes bogorensis TaxID=1610840 RepID=A0ABS5YR83_9ACTN|nr:hypothetical protein [Actinoplanes bogorensis]MBU2665957.1 hypothetical protein [Actinoplanes bogorensis]
MRDIVVTGSTGIGGAVASALGERALTIGRHGMIRADLSSMEETARAAAEISSVRAIICCAGVFTLRATHTAEGFERALALNYLSRYLLVRLLRPRRVILVANAGRYRDTLGPMPDLNLRAGGRGLRIAGRTQFANDLFAVELAARHPDMAVSCVFPGLVATRVFRDAPGVPAPLRRVLDAVQQRVGADPARAAETPVALAVEDREPGFYGPGCAPLPIPSRVLDGRRRELWEATDDLLKPWLT